MPAKPADPYTPIKCFNGTHGGGDILHPAGFTTIADVVAWAKAQQIYGEAHPASTAETIDEDWLRAWVHRCGPRYEEITWEHLAGLYHAVTGGWLWE